MRSSLEFLSMRCAGDDRFEAGHAATNIPADLTTLYGGQVAAQALVAASSTVDPPQRPHSLHITFTRRGDGNSPLVFIVERIRDGRTLTTRAVRVEQADKTIAVATVSFHNEQAAECLVPSRRIDVAGPDALPQSTLSDWHPLLDTRVAPDPLRDTASPAHSLDRMWCRTSAPLPDGLDPIMHQCLMVYMSDLPGGFAEAGLSNTPAYGTSIEHSVWFHDHLVADDWMLFDCEPVKVGFGRGLYRGTVHDRAGRLGAIIMQEMLLPSGSTPTTIA